LGIIINPPRSEGIFILGGLMSRTNRLIGALVITLVVAGAIVTQNYKKSTVTTSPSPTPTASAQTDTVRYPCVAGKTALDVLKSSHTVHEQTASFGVYVQGIDGKDGDAKHYWSFYVNGNAASVGASAYTCQGTEPIEWRYLSM
jgi:hypothetical protein